VRSGHKLHPAAANPILGFRSIEMRLCSGKSAKQIGTDLVDSGSQILRQIRHVRERAQSSLFPVMKEIVLKQLGRFNLGNEKRSG
jgi:hypothetical protein